jgi:glutamate---cysteine ligase / carboxylate-amine ligase
MTCARPSFTFGIEEEYFLVNTQTRALVSEPPKRMLDAYKAELRGQFSSEYQRSQIEVATAVCMTASDARANLCRLRKGVAAIASRHGLAPIAASTHPFTPWRTQRHTNKQRYNAIADDLKGLGQRMVIGGMHVHVGIDDDELRIAVMNGVRPYLPLLLALSASSPFWQGENTGLKSYRTAINGATPRSGMPESFASWRHYQKAIGTLVRSGAIEDATKIWWDVRPSVRFPTLELRITDICPLIDDALCIAALFRCLCRCLSRRTKKERRIPGHPLLLLNENRWRAQRYGLEQGLIDPDREKVVASTAVVDELLELVRDDAEHFGSTVEIEHARTILVRGTSADRQIALYRKRRDDGVTRARALKAVVDQLIAETVGDIAS